MNAIGSSLNGNIKMNTPDSRKWKKDEYKPTIVNGNNKKRIQTVSCKWKQKDDYKPTIVKGNKP
jgi:hypothetical protein